MRLGFGYENNDAYDNSIAGYNTWASGLKSALLADAKISEANAIRIFPEADDITQFNFITSYQTGGLTLAFEWDLWNVYVIEMWNMMLIANYQFNDVFGLTFRYSHEDFEADVPGGGEGSSNRFTIGPMFSITNNLTVGIEYSHAELDSDNTGDTSVDELYAETIFSF
jgi:predicted porin